MITSDDFTTLSACVLCLKKKVLEEFPFPNSFKGVAAEDTLVQLYLMDKGHLFLHTNKARVVHDANLSYKSLLRKINYQCKGTHRLLASAAKLKIKKIPYSTFYLDFPLLVFVSFYLMVFLGLGFGFDWVYLGILMVAFFIDFFELGKIFFFEKADLIMKIKTTVYVLLNEGIKIIDWPISVFREKYTKKDLVYVLNRFLYWEKIKIKKILNWETKNGIKF